MSETGIGGEIKLFSERFLKPANLEAVVNRQISHTVFYIN